MFLLILFCRIIGTLSWAALVAGFIGMLLFPVIHGTAIVMSLAIYWLVGSWLLRMLGRLGGFGNPVAALPAQEPLVIRRIILEEITPAGQERRVELKNVTPVVRERR